MQKSIVLLHKEPSDMLRIYLDQLDCTSRLTSTVAVISKKRLSSKKNDQNIVPQPLPFYFYLFLLIYFFTNDKRFLEYSHLLICYL
jgi:hypothetical protein